MIATKTPEPPEDDDQWDGTDIEPAPKSNANQGIIDRLNRAYYNEYSEGDRFS